MPNDDFTGLVDLYLEQQGAACIGTEDGELIVFTTATLEALLEQARRGPGKVAVLVRRGAMA